MLRRTPRAPKIRRIRKLRLLALLFVLGLLGLSAFTVGVLKAIAAQIPDLDPARQHQQANTYVYAGDGHTILEVLRGSQARIIVRSDQISPWFKHASVATEDQRFYEHRGIDLRGIARAAWSDVTGGLVQGGSTITQQFVKNALDANAPTLARKVREAALAWQLEQRWSKERILTAYLNTIYYGNGAYGVEQACRVYFGHNASSQNVNPAEAALLAGIPADPSLYDPVAHPSAAKARRNLVLLQMYEQDYLDARQYSRWVRSPMPRPRDVRLPSTRSQAAPYFANYVTDQLLRRFGPRGGLRRRSPREDDDRSRSPGDRARCNRNAAAGVGRPDGRARRARRAHRRGARHGRRSQLPPESVQPRHPRRASARFRVQAIRARRCAAGGNRAVNHVHLAPCDDRHRRPELACQQLRGRVPRADRPFDGDRTFGQHRLRTADERGRPAQRRPRRA